MAQSEATDTDIIPTASDGEQNATAVDWAALYEEFGFDTPDGAGNSFASHTQLVAAVQSSEQDVAGDAEGHIEDALDDGTLDTLTTSDDYGSVTTRGYIYIGGDR